MDNSPKTPALEPAEQPGRPSSFETSARVEAAPPVIRESRRLSAPPPGGIGAAAYPSGRMATKLGHASRRTVIACSNLGVAAKRASQYLQQRARSAQNERPLQLLGTIAGITFLCGVMLRIWRSHKS